MIDDKSLLRIDASNWHVTHTLDISRPQSMVRGLSVTSEGIAIALVGSHQHLGPSTRNNLWKSQIDPRTERRTEGALILVDANDLHVIRQFMGEVDILEGAPGSPIVCATLDSGSASLVDLRNGKILDQAGRRSSIVAPSETYAFDEFQMTPDGRKLYHTKAYGFVFETDISKGVFGQTHQLHPSVDAPAKSPLGLYRLHLSHDGQFIAVHVGNQISRKDGYSVMETAGDGVDLQRTLIATGSTAFTFAGPTNRPLANSLAKEIGSFVIGQDPPQTQYVNYDLVSLNRTRAGARWNLTRTDSLIAATLLGLPTSDRVLMNSGNGPTLAVSLPPDP